MTSIFAVVGLIFYYLIKTIFGNSLVGIITTLAFALVGFGISTLKMPETNSFAITRKTGGENIDEVILRAIKFKARGKRVYVYTKEENK